MPEGRAAGVDDSDWVVPNSERERSVRVVWELYLAGSGYLTILETGTCTLPRWEGLPPNGKCSIVEFHCLPVLFMEQCWKVIGIDFWWGVRIGVAGFILSPSTHTHTHTVFERVEDNTGSLTDSDRKLWQFLPGPILGHIWALPLVSCLPFRQQCQQPVCPEAISVVWESQPRSRQPHTPPSLYGHSLRCSMCLIRANGHPLHR